MHPDLVFHSLMNSQHLWPLAFLPFLFFICVVIVGSSNAVNLTDGLDGLAIGCTVIAAGALTVLTYVSSNSRWASYLDIQFHSQSGRADVFCGRMSELHFGFLWYNGTRGNFYGRCRLVVARRTLGYHRGHHQAGKSCCSSLVGFFVIEALSVILQVGSFKLRASVFFRMAPIHHHFELLGWSESKVIVRFWIAALVFALFALTTLKLR